MSVSQFSTEHLPASIQALLAIVSVEAVHAIINEYGGTRVALQKKPTDDHVIARLIGFDDYSRLCTVYAHEMLNIPRCLKAINALRNRSILADKRTGLSLAQLARKYTMTEDGITKALRRAEKQEYQQLSNNAQIDWTQL